MSPSPSYTSTSTPSGASSRAAYARAVLNDSRRRLPERARIFISGHLHRCERRANRDLVRKQEPACRKRGIPVQPQVGSIELAFQLDADPLVPSHVGARAEKSALQLDGLRRALDREIPLDTKFASVERDLGRGEANLRIACGVEEVGRLQVTVARLVEGRDRRHVDGSLDGRLVATLDRPGEARHPTLDGDEADLLDLELE